MKKTLIAAAATACMVAFANPAPAQVPADTNAALNAHHEVLAKNINSPDAGLRACAQAASRVLNNLDWQARTNKEAGAWAAIDRAMADYGRCVKSGSAGSAPVAVPGDVNAALEALHREIAANINNAETALQTCARTASQILNSLDWQARQAKDPAAWAAIESAMASYRTCVQAVPAGTRGEGCFRQRECGTTSRGGSLGNQNSNRNWQDSCTFYYVCDRVPSPRYREPGAEYRHR